MRAQCVDTFVGIYVFADVYVRTACERVCGRMSVYAFAYVSPRV